MDYDSFRNVCQYQKLDDDPVGAERNVFTDMIKLDRIPEFLNLLDVTNTNHLDKLSSRRNITKKSHEYLLWKKINNAKTRKATKVGIFALERTNSLHQPII